ncbi:peptidase family T4 protein [Xylariales sp. AK1849]|nr:peptidase family T4 protein [Xylariales sp. AK1849]
MSSAPSAAASTTPRMRIRDLLPNLFLGDYKTGPLNSLTDVPGVKVHTQEIQSDDGPINTGVTSIVPRDEWFGKACHAGLFSFNGAGELTGSHWINETGLLSSPIVLTNTASVGDAYKGIYQFAIKQDEGSLDWFMLPVVGETFDGFLNDIAAFAVKSEHVVHGLENVSSERVREGNVGGGTGMICHYFKGGTGSASRVVEGFDLNGEKKAYTLAALVQANYGKKAHFRIAGVPVGRILAEEDAKAAEADPAKEAELAALVGDKERKDGSIIVVIATDAPLHPVQLQRIAKRATVGLARVGGHGHNPSGDIFIAFSTGNEIPVQSLAAGKQNVNPYAPAPLNISMIDDTSINGLFEAATDAVEESIYNAVSMAETLVGYKGHKVQALPLDRVKEIMAKYL